MLGELKGPQAFEAVLMDETVQIPTQDFLWHHHEVCLGG